jgi:hypothetical protein
MKRTAWLQDRRMQKFRDVLSRWERGDLSMMDAGELLGMSEYFRRRGFKSVRLPGSAGFMEAYAAALVNETPPQIEIGAKRIKSGYLAVPLDDPEEPMSSSARGSTHAWTQIYLPGTGWIDFDPTTGSVGKIGLVTVAVVRDPHHAIPLHGTYIGFPTDHLGMDVQVSVTSGTPEAIRATPQRSTCTRFAQRV